MKIVHGGDIYRNKGCLDFSANINPLGMSESVEAAAKQAVENSVHYPDSRCEALTEAVSEKERLKTEWIRCGNGAADLIFQLCQAIKPKRAVVLAPTFAEYEQALRAVGCQVRHIFLNESDSFSVTEETIKEVCAQSFELLFLCNPNNPTGRLMKRTDLKRILNYCRRIHARLIIDECFLEFLRGYDRYSMTGYVSEYRELSVLKAFTKLYAMPGIRLGYLLCSDECLLNDMSRITQPWNVSTIAQAAGMAALEETEYVEKTWEYLRVQRSYLLEQLDELALQVYGSAANYIFFRAEPDFAEWMKARNILIRDCSNYLGLGRGFFRIAVRNEKENQALIRAWKERKEKDGKKNYDSGNHV